jgi:hypothetical protein
MNPGIHLAFLQLDFVIPKLTPALSSLLLFRIPTRGVCIEIRSSSARSAGA